MIFNKSPPFILTPLLNVFKQIFDIGFEPITRTAFFEGLASVIQLEFLDFSFLSAEQIGFITFLGISLNLILHRIVRRRNKERSSLYPFPKIFQIELEPRTFVLCLHQMNGFMIDRFVVNVLYKVQKT